jgi:hypothetical protein
MDKTSTAYKKAKREADKVYEKHSAYKSMYISKLYKEYGGKYKDETKKDSKLSTWRRERWIVVEPYLKEGKKIACGSEKASNIHACRPSKRVNKDTPTTIDSLIELHGKKKLLELVALKKKGKRINWEKGRAY